VFAGSTYTASETVLVDNVSYNVTDGEVKTHSVVLPAWYADADAEYWADGAGGLCILVRPIREARATIRTSGDEVRPLIWDRLPVSQAPHAAVLAGWVLHFSVGTRSERGRAGVSRNVRAQSPVSTNFPAARQPPFMKGRWRFDEVSDPLVLAAMEAVPREEFVPGNLRAAAHDDRALPIGSGTNDLAAGGGGLHDRGNCGCHQPAGCWRLAPARATRLRCSPRSPVTSIPWNASPAGAHRCRATGAARV